MKIVSIPPGDLGLCGFSFVHYSKKCFTQIYRALYGEAILVLMQTGGHQHGDCNVTKRVSIEVLLLNIKVITALLLLYCLKHRHIEMDTYFW